MCVQLLYWVQGIVVFFIVCIDVVFYVLLYNLLYNQVLYEQVVLFIVVNEDSLWVLLDCCFEVEVYGDGFFWVILYFGFMEELDILVVLCLCYFNELDFSLMCIIYFFSWEMVILFKCIGMVCWCEGLFVFLLKNVNGNLCYFNLLFNWVIELGIQVEI